MVNGGRIFAHHPVRVPVGLKTFHKGFHGYLYHVPATCALEERKRRRRTSIVSALEKHKEALLCSLLSLNYNLLCSV